MIQKHFIQALYTILIAGLLIASFLAGQALHSTPSALAEGENPPNELAPLGTAVNTSTINQIAIVDNRFHIRTDAVVDGISYFVYSTEGTNAPNANRMLMIANTAIALAKQLQIIYDTDSTHNLPGCNTNNCRNIVILEIIK